MGARAGTVVLSAHFDDAVFSCWSLLHGADVTVLTVFSAGPADDRVSSWDEDTGVTSRERMAQRAEENRAALTGTGVGIVDLGQLESAYDGGEIDEEALRPHLEGAATVWAPAGIGRGYVHPDHVTVRKACLALRRDAGLYADNPYTGFRADPKLPWRLALRYRPRVVALDDHARRAKAAAIACYAGELPKLERGFGLGSLTEPDRLRYEVLWGRR